MRIFAALLLLSVASGSPLLHQQLPFSILADGVKQVHLVNVQHADQFSVYGYFDEHTVVALSNGGADDQSGRTLYDPSAERLYVLIGCQPMASVRILFTALTEPHRLLVAAPLEMDMQDTFSHCYSYRIASEPIRLLSDSTVPSSYNSSLLNAQISQDRKHKIDEFIDTFNSTDRIRYFATYLTGEYPGSPIITRQANSEAGMLAADWIKQQMVNRGFKCDFHFFKVNGYSDGVRWNPNVVCDWPLAINQSTPLVIVGAHYDDRQYDSRSTTARAPGANDDGSGTALLLELASRISDYQAHFQHPVRLIAFSGEEQGLYGSAAYARECSRNQLEIRAMLQADMVGYNSRLVSDPKARKRVAFVKGNASKKLTAYIKQLVKRFVPRINIEDTNACCSDHQSFHEQGYESVGFVEAGGYLIDPQYHKPGDIVERAGYDLEQIQMIAKAVGASLADLAQID